MNRYLCEKGCYGVIWCILVYSTWANDGNYTLHTGLRE